MARSANVGKIVSASASTAGVAVEKTVLSSLFCLIALVFRKELLARCGTYARESFRVAWSHLFAHTRGCLACFLSRLRSVRSQTW